jgi:hypothetical protein
MNRTNQTEFRHALLDPIAPVPSSLTDGAGRPAGRRFSVYRNNVAVSLTEALIDGFPACYNVLGDEHFRGMASVYLRAHPPETPVMARFGGALPAFLDAAPQVANMRWIADLARLEFALRESYHAADAKALTADALAAIPPEALGETRFALAPSLRLIQSDWPVLSIWRRALNPKAPQASPTAQDVLILRPDFDPLPQLLASGDAAFVMGLAQGFPLSEAAGHAAGAAPDHDPTAILTLLMQSNALLHYPEA